MDIWGCRDYTFVQLRITVESCYHYLGDLVTLRIYFYYLRSMLLAAFSSRVTSVFEVRGLNIAYSN